MSWNVDRASTPWGDLGNKYTISCVYQGIPHYVYVEGFSRHKGTGDESGYSVGEESPGWQAVMAVVRHAAVLITEEMPTPPYAQWLQVSACIYLIDHYY